MNRKNIERIKNNLKSVRTDLSILYDELDEMLKADGECTLSNHRYFIKKTIQKIDTAFQDLNMVY